MAEAVARSKTEDRGAEPAGHRRLAATTGFGACCCGPRSPWQRATNENTSKLLRQYLPKKTDLSRYSRADPDKIAGRPNNRPREVLGHATPSAMLR